MEICDGQISPDCAVLDGPYMDEESVSPCDGQLPIYFIMHAIKYRQVRFHVTPSIQVNGFDYSDLL